MKSAANVRFSIVENNLTANKEDSDDNTSQAAILATLDEWDYIQEQRYTDGQLMRRVEALDLKNKANLWLERVG